MNQADTAWMLVSTALVLLMTPALAFFYGGLVRSKNALNTTYLLRCWVRACCEEESVGMDLTQHGEEAYVHAGGSGAAV